VIDIALPTVSVVIPTYDRGHLLEAVVSPLLEERALHELIVVVDGSPDDSLARLERIAARDGRLRPIGIENSGRNAARWAGARAATGDVILFLDDDVVASPGLVVGHARGQAEGRGRILVGYMPIEEASAARGPASRLYADEYERTVADYEREPDAILTRLWGGNVSVWHEDLERSGAMDEDFVAARHVDRHFGLVCHRAGLTATFDRDLHAIHRHSRDVRSFGRDSREQGIGLFWIHAVHGDVVGPLDRRRFAAGLPAPARWMVALARRPRGYRLVAGALGWATTVAGRLPIAWAEVTALRLLRRVEQQHGAFTSRSPSAA
jgi:glycosyltransferase involved in cell wall biosynthesis